MRHGSLFSGIGGFDLAAEWMGWENVFHCENNKFCQRILKYYWPDAELFEDIKQSSFLKYRGKIDIVTGGFPCQPYSVAGKRKGKADDRHLWPEMLRAIREIQPSWVVGENVPGLLSWKRGMVLTEIKTDLEDSGFEVFPPLILPACGKNAPHRRDRIWIIAHAIKERYEHRNNVECGELQNIKKRLQNNRETCRSISNRATSNTRLQRQEKPEQQPMGTEQLHEGGNVADPDNQGLQGCKINRGAKEIGSDRIEQFAGCVQSNWEKFPVEQPVRDGNDGLSSRLVRETISAGGNAVVPQLVLEIFKSIEQYNQLLDDGGNKS